VNRLHIYAAVLFAACIFCTAYAQEEAVIKLDSPEEIDQFQKMLQDDNSKKVMSDLETALSDSAKQPAGKTVLSESEFKVYKPQAKEDAGTEKVKQKAKVVRQISEEEFKALIPQAKEDSEASVKPESNIKWLESDEDMEEFNEILKKAGHGVQPQ